jgi:hypothetical protein
MAQMAGKKSITFICMSWAVSGLGKSKQADLI